MSYMSGRRPGAFTLIELLVVTVIIALLVAILLPALAGARASALKVKELAAARQLMLAYLLYAEDHGGSLLRGELPDYVMGDGVDEPRYHAADESGRPLAEHIAAPYPWRLAPWMDYDFRGMIIDKALYRRLAGLPDDPVGLYSYQDAFSQHVSLGMNSVGRKTTSDNGLILEDRLMLRRADQVRLPAMLLVFASARSESIVPADSQEMLPGCHRVLAPYIVDAELPYSSSSFSWNPDLTAHDFGFLDLRHGGKAVTAMVDGHATAMGLPPGATTELRDMRHWSNWATHPAWRPGDPKGP